MLELSFQLPDPDLFFSHEFYEPALVVLQPVILDLHHPVHHPIQKMTVVRYQNHGPLEVPQPPFQPVQ